MIPERGSHFIQSPSSYRPSDFWRVIPVATEASATARQRLSGGRSAAAVGIGDDNMDEL